MRFLCWIVTAGFMLGLTGCCDYLIRRVESLGLEEVLVRREPGDELSPSTVQVLKESELVEVHRRNPVEALGQLQKKVGEIPSQEELLALSEICGKLARRSDKDHSQKAHVYHYQSAGYAYHYLQQSSIQEILDQGPPPEDALFSKRARKLYNAGVAGWLRAKGYAGRAEPSVEKTVADFSVVRRGFAWRAEEFGALLFGPENSSAPSLEAHRTEGLGVPLLCLRAAQPGDSAQAFRYPREISFPVTAFLCFGGSLKQWSAAQSGQPLMMKGNVHPIDPMMDQLELYNPLAHRSVQVGSRVFPLEADLDLPLHHFRKHTDLEGIGDLGFLNPDKLRDRQGIYFLEPYQPGKIPLLLIHGARSSPTTWLTLVQELRSDPQIRERYQFWFYLYPSGDQYLKAAADLRQALGRLREMEDPQRRDPAWDRMVVVGHSMGGLVARLLTIDSGDEFGRLIAPKSLDNLRASTETEAEFRRVFFFERQPYVQRVVFIATPHRGSKLSVSLPAKLAGQFTHPPRAAQEAARELIRSNPGLEPNLVQRLVPTSDMIAPGSPFLEVLAAQSQPKDVSYHSILGVASLTATVFERTLAGSSWDEKSDGVVPVASARLKGVDSELVVPADHNAVKDHPKAMEEMKRILRLHLERGQTAESETSH